MQTPAPPAYQQLRQHQHAACCPCSAREGQMSCNWAQQAGHSAPARTWHAQALKDREEAVRNGKLTTIIFIRDKNVKGQEVSGYIDYGHRQVALRGGGRAGVTIGKRFVAALRRMAPRTGGVGSTGHSTQHADPPACAQDGGPSVGGAPGSKPILAHTLTHTGSRQRTWSPTLSARNGSCRGPLT